MEKHPRTVPLPYALCGSVVAAPGLLRVKPAASAFMARYVKRFPVRDVGGKWWVHSHLPPLNGPAYRRFVKTHLVRQLDGPSHAQIGVTHACPQRCAYCYNKQRHGRPLDTDLTLRLIDELREMGVVWLGLTGGEPLLERNLAPIVERAGEECCVKLFTSGCGLTPGRADELVSAGLDSVSVSLDHRDPAVHDEGRGYPGAHRAALAAIEDFLSIGGLHVGVSAVVTREMIADGEVEPFLQFLQGLGVHEAWISELKPSAAVHRSGCQVISEGERRGLCGLQDRWNGDRRHTMTVNYLGDFEGGEAFGCNAGVKMVYIDAYGEVSPCVFTPLSFGNVRGRSLDDLVGDMRERFTPQSVCWINSNYEAVQEEAGGDVLLDRARAEAVLARCSSAPAPAFHRILYGEEDRST